MSLPKKYAWVGNEGAPKHMVEAIKHYGTLEVVGKNHSPNIMRWALEVGLKNIYTNDEIAWCGLYVAICVQRAGWEVVEDPLWARNWAKFGTEQKTAMYGDVLVFERGSGGHVGFYIGENKTHFYVLGGNQSNSVNIMLMDKKRLLAIRRPKWKTAQPANVRVIKLTTAGSISTNEA